MRAAPIIICGLRTRSSWTIRVCSALTRDTGLAKARAGPTLVQHCGSLPGWKGSRDVRGSHDAGCDVLDPSLWLCWQAEAYTYASPEVQSSSAASAEAYIRLVPRLGAVGPWRLLVRPTAIGKGRSRRAVSTPGEVGLASPPACDAGWKGSRGFESHSALVDRAGAFASAVVWLSTGSKRSAVGRCPHEVPAQSCRIINAWAWKRRVFHSEAVSLYFRSRRRRAFPAGVVLISRAVLHAL